MSDISRFPKTYNPTEVESELYNLWLDSGAFTAKPDRSARPFVVMMPLPNVTGALHMGHAMDNVLQDLFVRWHRMLGDNTLWMPGTDHAGIATQAVVEKRLKELEGLTRQEVGREKLVQRIWDWKDQFQSRIIAQQQRMGCSCDWSRHRFTMDNVCANAVRQMFFILFREGLVYRGKKMVNWDAALQTSISDDEVYHETVKGYFWRLKYPVVDPLPGEPKFVVIATTRPETMLGDTAVAVHPEPEKALAIIYDRFKCELNDRGEKNKSVLQDRLDEIVDRQQKLLPVLNRLRDMAQQGRKIMLPLVGRHIPLICDEWAKPEMGTGCVKITPAHDHNDYDVWTRHCENIDIINILNSDGSLNGNAGKYEGLDRLDARDRILSDMQELGLMNGREERDIEIGHSDRSKTPIEPYLSDQWFIRMGDVDGGVVLGRGTASERSSTGLVQAAIDAVNDGKVRIHPSGHAKTYLDWLSEKRDWPLSRQLWWGHRIPVWSRTIKGSELGVTILDNLFCDDSLVRLQFEDEKSFILKNRDILDSLDIPNDEFIRIDVCLRDTDIPIASALIAEGYEQCDDVMDTWFSSALWPFSSLGWPDPNSAMINEGQSSLAAADDQPNCLDYYYPGSLLITGRDIITLWVARMVLAGEMALGKTPFKDVFIHASILDGNGERMSKSKGNGIDPVDIIDSYGCDAMRYVLCDMQTGTQDIRLPVTAICPQCGHHNELSETRHGQSIFTYICGKISNNKRRKDSCGAEFDILGTMPTLPAAKLTSERFEIGRAFCIKLWNSARFAFGHLTNLTNKPRPIEELQLEDRWLLDELNRTIEAVDQNLEEYNPSAALNVARDFLWGVLCDWYLEVVKPRITQDNESATIAKQVLAYTMDQVLRLFHPFVPFITEFLWQRLNEVVPERNIGTYAHPRKSNLLVTARWPKTNDQLYAPEPREIFSLIKSVVHIVREFRSTNGIPFRQSLDVTLKVRTDWVESALKSNIGIVTNLLNISNLDFDTEATRQPGSAFIPVNDLQIFIHNVLDDDVERERLKKEHQLIEKRIKQIDAKLSNQKFTEKAPINVVQEQRARLTELLTQKDAILALLAELG